MTSILFAISVFVGAVIVLGAFRPKTRKREIGYISPSNVEPKILESAWVVKAEKELLKKQLRGEVKWKQ